MSEGFDPELDCAKQASDHVSSLPISPSREASSCPGAIVCQADPERDAPVKRAKKSSKWAFDSRA